MRVKLIAMLAGTIGLLGVSAASAAPPVNIAAIQAAIAGTSPVVKAQTYCYRHYTYTSRRRFLHWGSCGGGGGRVYCYRHYTDTSRRRFLHWGHC